MTIREIAKAFDMEVKELAAHLGCSRQALYMTELSNRRVKSAVEHLVLLNEKMYLDEQSVINRRFNRRVEAIQAFERLLLKEGAEG